MRRNTVTLIKLALCALTFVILGPMALRFMTGSSGHHSSVNSIKVDANQGLPVEPLHKESGVEDTEQDADPNKMVDWHDYKKIAEDELRKGPGEQGQAVILSAGEDKQKQALYQTNGFNALASDKMSLDRSLKDIRHPDCKKKKYLANLPDASVVIPFHNEHWTTLLRTVHSVLNRSPKHLIKEVILADDASTKDHCKQPLDDYVAKTFTNVKVVRQGKREGLIRTRLTGAKAATGKVLIFLDSHVEANINWLPPLLDPIQRDKKTVVCPFIDVLDFDNFAYRAQDEGARGAFDWEFFYKRLPLLPADLKNPAEPFRSPVMAGGLFAISTEWFWTLGGYDPGLDIWGGEQYELSFKLWQCGGQMVDAPCSRVGHVYRKFAPFPNPGIGDFVGKNYKRVAEVWMDEYKEYIYKHRPHYRNIDAGDLSAQLAIREKLKCKSFKWFMEEIAFDLVKKYPPIEPPAFGEGEIRNVGSNKCIDTRYKGEHQRFGLEQCVKDNPAAGGEQQFELTWHKDLRPRKRSVCFDVSQSIQKSPVVLFGCHGMQGNQYWKYNLDTKQLFHPISGQCLDCDKDRLEIFMSHCVDSKDTQKWQIEKVNIKEIKKLWAE